MAISQTYVPATPRSTEFKYYPTGSGGRSTGSTSVIQQGNVDPGVEINKIGTGNVVVDIAPNEDEAGILDVTMGSVSGIALATTGSGNTVQDLSLSGSTLTKTMNYRVNAVAESADTTQGTFIRCANQYPSITNSGNSSAINFPYKQLIGGAGISISAPSGSSNITISASATTYTWRYYISSSVTFSAYESKSYQISGHGFSVYAAFPSIIYPSRPATATEANIPFAVRIVIESNLIYFVVTNPVDFNKALMGGSYLTALLTSN